jgi:drug/metabolite transporter (DMT)-like permease
MPPSLPSNPHIPLLALIGGALSIAFAPIFVRVSEVGPLSTALWRLLLAWPALWLWTVMERRQRPDVRRPSRSTDYLRLAAAGLFFAGDLSVWHWKI